MDIQDRVRRLERWNMALVVAVAAAGLLGAAGRGPKEIRAERVVLSDPRGNDRIVLDAAGEGMAGIWLFDKGMKQQVLISATDDNQAAIRLYNDGKPEARVSISTARQGGSAVTLTARDGRALWMTALDGAEPRVVVRHGDETVHRFP